jgi:hypothetical protein
MKSENFLSLKSNTMKRRGTTPKVRCYFWMTRYLDNTLNTLCKKKVKLSLYQAVKTHRVVRL